MDAQGHVDLERVGQVIGAVVEQGEQLADLLEDAGALPEAREALGELELRAFPSPQEKVQQRETAPRRRVEIGDGRWSGRIEQGSPGAEAFDVVHVEQARDTGGEGGLRRFRRGGQQLGVAAEPRPPEPAAAELTVEVGGIEARPLEELRQRRDRLSLFAARTQRFDETLQAETERLAEILEYDFTGL